MLSQIWNNLNTLQVSLRWVWLQKARDPNSHFSVHKPSAVAKIKPKLYAKHRRQILPLMSYILRVIEDVNKFITNKLHLYMKKEPLLRVSAIFTGIFRENQCILKDTHSISTQLCQIVNAWHCILPLTIWQDCEQALNMSWQYILILREDGCK